MSNNCHVCNKTVYPMEKLTADDKIFHKACLKCGHCDKQITLGNFAALNQVFYCKPHFKQLFAVKGNYTDGFLPAEARAGIVRDPVTGEATRIGLITIAANSSSCEPRTSRLSSPDKDMNHVQQSAKTVSPESLKGSASYQHEPIVSGNIHAKSIANSYEEKTQSANASSRPSSRSPSPTASRENLNALAAYHTNEKEIQLKNKRKEIERLEQELLSKEQEVASISLELQTKRNQLDALIKV